MEPTTFSATAPSPRRSPWRRPVPALALLLALALTFPALAAPPEAAGSALDGAWSRLAGWLQDGAAAVWGASILGDTGDKGLGLDPDGTDPDPTTDDEPPPPPEDGGSEPPPP